MLQWAYSAGGELCHSIRILFRQVLGRFATGVTVITVCKDDVKRGMTANAFTSVSLNPPLILVSVDKKADTHGMMMEV